MCNRSGISKKRIVGGLLLMILLILLDQWAKLLAVAKLKDQSDVTLIPGILDLHYLENRGAAFGMLQNRQWIFVLIGIVFLLIAAYVYLRMPKDRKFLLLGITIITIAAGAIGNLIDRVLQNYVVDFFMTTFINFPVFNVADIYVTVGTIVLIISILFVYKDDDFEFLSRKRKDN